MKTMTDEECRKILEIMSFPLNDQERSYLWEDFIEWFHQHDSNEYAFRDCLLEAAFNFSQDRNIIINIELENKSNVQSRINDSIKLLGLPKDFTVYIKDTDSNCTGIEQLTLYAKALSGYGFSMAYIDGEDTTIAVIIRSSDKTKFNNLVSISNLNDTFSYF